MEIDNNALIVGDINTQWIDHPDRKSKGNIRLAAHFLPKAPNRHI